MFSNAKVGDSVWSLTRGWGTIIGLYNRDEFPILVKFDKSRTYYTVCGKLYVDDVYPTLFWDEIKFEIPKKPLPKLEVDAKVLVWNNDEGKYRRHFHSFTEDGRIRTWSDSTSSFTANNTDCYTVWRNWELYQED